MRHVLPFAIVAIAAPAAFAIQCGDTVSGSIALTANLNCSIGASNTTINLNGFSITCMGSGFNGSCQGTTASLTGLPFGIASDGFDSIVVQGPGTIGGFGVGVGIHGGLKHSVFNLTITGPPAFGDSQRGMALGVYLNEVACPPVNPLVPERGSSANISSNQVNNQATGILLVNSGCIQVFSNKSTYNSALNGNSHGIAVAGGEHNSIYRNTVSNNGQNRSFDSGITASFTITNNVLQPTDHNIIYANQVLNNCGDGIAVGPNSTNNNISSNTAKFNGDLSTARACGVPKTDEFHDLAEFMAGQGNLWNPNNVCHTQTTSIPAGVCNPWE